MNKNDKKALRKSINECLRSLHLPVEKPGPNALMKDPNIVVFSQICNDHVCGTLVIAFDEERRVLDLTVATRERIPMERVKDVLEFLDLIHMATGIYHYRICPCCNCIEVRADLYIPEKHFPAGKLKRLLKTILEDTYLVMPYIRRLVNHGGDPKGLFESCDEQLEKKEGEQDDTLSTAHMSEIRTILTDMGVKMLAEEDPEETQIGMGFHLDNGESYTLTITNICDLILLDAWPHLEFGTDKMESMKELINVLNNDNLIASYIHVIGQEDRWRLRRVKVIMMDNDQLDAEEFQSVLERLIGTASLMFPVLWMRLVSDQDPKTLIEQRLLEMRERSTR
jgi:hypothetical protein